MIPSLVAGELRSSIVEYLATTFALSDDEAYKALSDFLLDDKDGIFRGPYLRVRLPFVDAPEGSDLGVAWSPPGFRPYAHQLAAWHRLSGRGRQPKPTLITTGTGSGKSEGFLIPAIDHAIWARERGQRGIKALILYPMNALVTDQERRIAMMLADPTAQAAGVTGGVWIGDDGTVKGRSEMSDDHLISDAAALLADPPDILLTNYKMLDRLLTNSTRKRLWAANTPPTDAGSWEQPLTYLVLDEFHSYDGAQGTDVAMLLRRLGYRLGTATQQSPLDGVGCVGTSATLGSSPSSAHDMCTFASRIFGTRFDASSIVGEQRKTVAEVCPDIDFSLPIPVPGNLEALDLDDLDALAEAFTGTFFDDPQDVGDRLVRHHLTAALLRVAADRPRIWPDAVAGVAQQVPAWGEAHVENPASVSQALERFVALVSQSRGRSESGEPQPLFSVEVQIWIREVTRLKRSVNQVPVFRWADSPPLVTEDAASLELPSVYCRACGRSGWMGVANRAAGMGGFAIERLVYAADTDPYYVSVSDRARTRTMVRAHPDEPDILWLDTKTGQVHHSDEPGQRIPVLVGGMTGEDRNEEAREQAAQRQQCPSCGTRDSVRFLGSRVTTLASVGITQMFGSNHVADDERKLLAFTDSVQDASHRAAFFSGRTHRFNLRATLSGALQTKGRVQLDRVAEVVLAAADQKDDPAQAIFSLVPPDLLWEGRLTPAWNAHGTPAADNARVDLELRLSFDAAMEAGLRARLGRTLETTGTAVASALVAEEEWGRIVPFAKESVQANTGLLLAEDETIRTWVAGIIERLRLRGGIYHPFLDTYVGENGKRWHIWGGGDPLAPKFPKGISAPSFFASAPSDEFDPIGGATSWLGIWSKKVLSIEGQGADRSIEDLLNQLSEIGVLEMRRSTKGLVWGLPPDRIEFVDIALDGGTFSGTELRCNLCALRHYTRQEQFAQWQGRSCMRLRCTGSYEPAPTVPTNYYQGLYRSGQIRRVVAAEHTGMLTREKRERVETGFKNGGRADAPNVLAATPTLEMGIDIGDLSAVMLTAVPPKQSSYIQRVGRAGRKTGNAFIITFAEGDPRSLYFLHDPELMIAGEIAAPSCYLDAIEILRRQYLAFLVDRAAEGEEGSVPQAGDMPRTIWKVATTGMESGGWLSEILAAGKKAGMVEDFVDLFGHHLTPGVAVRLTSWASDGLREHVEAVVERWHQHIKTLTNQRDRLREREKRYADIESPSAEDLENLGRVVSELRYIAGRIREARDQDTLGALETLGLLPNYTLFDDTVTLEASLWHLNGDHDPSDAGSRRFISDGAEYTRPAPIAIRELAPGNYFYVDAHRLKIDAVDNGTENEPAHSVWRVCPACAWVAKDPGAHVTECPRCGTNAIADQGARLPVLPMRVVSSTEQELTSRVSDESDDRDRVFHEVVTSIDIDPNDISEAHLHTGTTFGVEAARAATIRYFNLGLHGSRAPQSRQVRIAGQDITAALFPVCRFCGGVFAIRGDAKDPDDSKHHRAWCKVRSGARKADWIDLALGHELVTEAVRILLPIAEFEVHERVASFKAALMLGLRDSFGGDPDHIRVLLTDFPAPGEDPNVRNRFVVLHDTVPGGTGYLQRLGDPESLRNILTRAVDLISTCECQARGRPGCHKCLYTSVGRHEIPLVSRSVALDLLEEILRGWQLLPADKGTITGVNLTPVQQSELERMFKQLLHRWADTGSALVTSHPDPERPDRVRFDLRFQDGPHWEIREQVSLNAHATIPDFYATRMDVAGAAPVAIYLDGYEYHGADPEQVDKDAEKRASLRESGTSVWALTWPDVRAALTAANKGTTVSAALPVNNAGRTAATVVAKQALGSDHDALPALSHGTFEQLMTYLRYPEAPTWRAMAQGLALGPARQHAPMYVDDAGTAIEQAALGLAIEESVHRTPTVAIRWPSHNGLSCLVVVAEDGGDPPTVVASLDTKSEMDKGVWSDWLHLGNLFQYLGAAAIVSTTRTFVATPGTDGVAAPADALGDASDERLADILDASAVPLVRAAAAAGWDQFVVGMGFDDADDTPIEVAWPQQGIGILPTGGSRPNDPKGWELRYPSEWTSEALIEALEKRGT